MLPGDFLATAPPPRVLTEPEPLGAGTCVIVLASPSSRSAPASGTGTQRKRAEDREKYGEPGREFTSQKCHRGHFRLSFRPSCEIGKCVPVPEIDLIGPSQLNSGSGKEGVRDDNCVVCMIKRARRSRLPHRANADRVAVPLGLDDGTSTVAFNNKISAKVADLTDVIHSVARTT